MKQSKIKIQLEFHQEIAKSALWCPFSFWNFAVSRVWRTGRPDHYFPRGPRRYPSCGQSILRTLLLAAVAVMAAKASDLPGGPPSCPELGLGGPRVTRFVCAHCTSTGLLSSRGLFLNRRAVRRHIAAAKHCREADMGIREIQVEARAGDVMAGGGGAAGRPAPDVRHQPPGDMARAVPQISFRYHPEHLKSTDVLTHIAKRLEHTDTMHEVVSSSPIVMQLFRNVLYKYIRVCAGTYWYILCTCKYIPVCTGIYQIRGFHTML